MRTRNLLLSGSPGFTLLELVITLVIAAIMGSMLVQITSTVLSGSIRPVAKVQEAEALYQVMEKMISDYNKSISSTTDATPLATFSSHLQTNPGGLFGTYTLITDSYVTYDSNGNESAASGTGTGPKILKVKISNPAGDITLTTLFTQ